MNDEKDSGGALDLVETQPVTLPQNFVDLISCANANPRSIQRAIGEAMTLATLSEETAASMCYALKRGDRFIEGPSVRLSEIMAYAWRNLLTTAAISHEGRDFVEATATCFDLERVVGAQTVARRRIVDRRGVRYGVDMIGVTSMAAIAIASRNARFAVIPRSYVDEVYAVAKAASVGKAGTMAQKRQNALEWHAKAGLTEAQVLAVLGVRGVADIGVDELARLRAIKTALKDGETTIDELLARGETKTEGAQRMNAAANQTGTLDPNDDVPY